MFVLIQCLKKTVFSWQQPATQVDMAPTFLGIAGEKNGAFCAIYISNALFTKTGSGQT